MDIMFKDLIGFEGSLLELSNALQRRGCEDIGYFGNMDEIVDSGVMIVATDNDGDNHIRLEFEVVQSYGEYEISLATIIKINDIERA